MWSLDPGTSYLANPNHPLERGLREGDRPVGVREEDDSGYPE